MASEAKGRGFDPRQPHQSCLAVEFATAQSAAETCRQSSNGNHKKMNFSSLMDAAAYWACRAAGYALLNLGEDAALIALMFC